MHHLTVGVASNAAQAQCMVGNNRVLALLQTCTVLLLLLSEMHHIVGLLPW